MAEKCGCIEVVYFSVSDMPSAISFLRFSQNFPPMQFKQGLNNKKAEE